jgi:hypothetical protein
MDSACDQVGAGGCPSWPMDGQLKWDCWNVRRDVPLFAGRSPARPAPIRVSCGPSPELSRIGVVSGPGVRSRVVMEAGRGHRLSRWVAVVRVRAGSGACRGPGLTAGCGPTVRRRGAGCPRARGVQVPRVDLATIGRCGWRPGPRVRVAAAFWAGRGPGVRPRPFGLARTAARFHDGCTLTVPGACRRCSVPVECRFRVWLVQDRGS